MIETKRQKLEPNGVLIDEIDGFNPPFFLLFTHHTVVQPVPGERPNAKMIETKRQKLEPNRVLAATARFSRASSFWRETRCEMNPKFEI